MSQFWVGSTNVHFLLREIGGWFVDCPNAREAYAAIEFVKERGWVTTRKHYAPAFPEGALAYELTDKGLEQVGKNDGLTVQAQVTKRRNWYRKHASQPWLKQNA